MIQHRGPAIYGIPNFRSNNNVVRGRSVIGEFSLFTFPERTGVRSHGMVEKGAPLRVRYRTIEFDDMDIHVRTLRDRQQFDDPEGVAADLGICSASWSMFGQIWDSARVLADLMQDFDIEGKRILEVGCGIGLASLVLNHRLADITATDHHPEAEAFLLANVGINNKRLIPFFRTGWSDEDCGLGRFDLIVASDLLYERDNVPMLAAFIEQHSNVKCQFIHVEPGRGLAAQFRKKMKTYGFCHRQEQPDVNFADRIHTFNRGSRPSGPVKKNPADEHCPQENSDGKI